MADNILYTNYLNYSATVEEFESYDLIRASPTSTERVSLVVTNGGTLNLADELGSVAAYVGGSPTLGLDLTTGDGNDEISRGTGSDTVHAGGGNDTIFGGGGLDLLYGGAGDDTLWVTGAGSTGWGDDGNDILNGGAAVTLDGGRATTGFPPWRALRSWAGRGSIPSTWIARIFRPTSSRASRCSRSAMAAR